MDGIGHWRAVYAAFIPEKGCAQPASYTTFDNISIQKLKPLFDLFL
jgi:hypothetical protein